MPNTKRSLSLYWKCQLIGWSLAALYWAFVGYLGSNFSLTLGIFHFLGDLCIYIIPTHLFRNLSKQQHWEQLRPKKLLPIVITAILLLGSIFMVLTITKNYWFRALWEPNFVGSLSIYFKQSWLTTWMTGIRLMCIWILAYYLYHYAQAEIRASKESARLSLVAKNAQLDNLTAQLNPHFFFNSLNNIKALVNENPIAARRAIDLLSDLLRTSLYNRDHALITLREELDLINDYVELEKMRFEERLQVSFEIESQTLDAKVLPLSLQNLVENAIKHGIAQQPEGGIIFVGITAQDGFLFATVQNPGKLQIHANTGLGLKNLQERLQLQFNGKASFSIEILDEQSVLATLKTPLQWAN
ncbi:histidine kinase [Pedobacter sp. KR3-3]|uniref:Histidine kinase n=1 Tax=Pedobacter albus TaxID=3113905 RepID=A0ABU7IAZ3_9SPHI|nr:histidine kinase [Pedobacter sp. KR3-3]MEE1946637.1 histidine kinase [Pedobacter sp. KR3-3]